MNKNLFIAMKVRDVLSDDVKSTGLRWRDHTNDIDSKGLYMRQNQDQMALHTPKDQDSLMLRGSHSKQGLCCSLTWPSVEIVAKGCQPTFS